MKSISAFLFIPLVLFFLSVSGTAYGQDPAAMPPTPGPSPGPVAVPAVQYVAPGIFQIDQCRIDKNRDRVEFPATVNMQEGLLEYLIVGDAGKLHESLLKTDVSPYALNIALLLAGLEGSLDPLAAQGQNKRPSGTRINILFRIKDGEKEREVAARKWIRADDALPASIPWVYTGSIILDGVFMAQTDKSIVALFHDPLALVDHQLPEGANDEIWFVNEKEVQPVGTPLTVIIEKLP